MPSQKIDEMTQREWRELGFFYDRDDMQRAWKLIGSKAGLQQFVDVLQKYSADPRNERVSEHQHLGPYGDLKVGTWATPEITEHWIAGPPDSLHRLALAIQARLEAVSVGESISLRAEFAPRSPYELVLEVQADCLIQLSLTPLAAKVQRLQQGRRCLISA